MNQLRSISQSVLCMLLGAGLLASQAQAQLSGGTPSQLRPPSGVHNAPQGGLVPPAKTTPLVAQSNTLKARKALLTDLPVTDFGKIYVQQTQTLSVSLRKLVYGDPNNANKTTEVPEIRISGAHAASFVASPPKCDSQITNKGLSAMYECTTMITFHPTTEGPQTAVLVASFPDGDQFTGRISGISQPTSIAMPAPGGVRGSAQQASVSNLSNVQDKMVTETLDFGYVATGKTKTLRVATQYPAGSYVLSKLGGAQVEPSGAFDLGETTLSINGAKNGEKASFTITYNGMTNCGTHVAYFKFRDADGKVRNLALVAKGGIPNPLISKSC